MDEIVLLEKNSIQKRAERIASALFLVSNVMSDTEILKTKIRQLSLDLVSNTLLVKDSDGSSAYQAIKLVQKIISELISILTITSISGLLSNMNASILKSELSAFILEVDNLQNSDQFKTDVSKDFFLNKETPFLPQSKMSLINIKDKNDAFVFKKDKSNRKEQRTKSIVSFIEKHPDVSIKDISSSIKGCSEKTIQRELNYLIDTGVIKKTGERRWSRYSLVG